VDDHLQWDAQRARICTKTSISWCCTRPITQQVGIGDRFLKEPAQLQLTHDQLALAQRGHYFVDRSNLVLRDVYSHAIQFGQHQEADEAKTLGLCLGLAPQINPNDFIPRAAEIDAMSQVLQPGNLSVDSSSNNDWSLVVWVGSGRINWRLRTSSVTTFATLPVFLLNTSSELRVKASFRGTKASEGGCEFDQGAPTNRPASHY